MTSNNSDRTRSNQQEQNASEQKSLINTNKRYARGFTIIPNWVIEHVSISRDAKLLYGLLQKHAWQSGECFPGYETLMREMQCRRDALSKYIKELKESGLIEVQRRGLGLSNIYKIVDWTQEDFDQHLKLKSEKPTSGSMEKPTSVVRKSDSNNTKSKNTQFKNTQLSKGKALKTKKERGASAPPTRSHIANGTIRNGTTPPGRTSKPQTPTLTKPPITQDEIDHNRAQGRNASGFQHIGVSLEHMGVLNRQFGNGRTNGSPPGSDVQREPATGKQGNWKKAPMMFQAVIAEWFSLEMHDQAINSTITRVHRIYQKWLTSRPDLTEKYTAEQLQETFYNLMQEARTKTKHAKITKRAPNGLPNRTPFFLACLEDLSGLREQPPGEQLPAPPPN